MSMYWSKMSCTRSEISASSLTNSGYVIPELGGEIKAANLEIDSTGG